MSTLFLKLIFMVFKILHLLGVKLFAKSGNKCPLKKGSGTFGRNGTIRPAHTGAVFQMMNVVYHIFGRLQEPLWILCKCKKPGANNAAAEPLVFKDLRGFRESLFQERILGGTDVFHGVRHGSAPGSSPGLRR